MNTGDLYTTCVDYRPIYHDLGQSAFDWWEVMQCEECGTEFSVSDNHTCCPNCNAEVYTDGPIYNFLWPVPPVDTYPAVLAHSLKELPLALLRLEEDGRLYLALTGCGENMAWQICQGYINLQYLPPARLASALPIMAGARLDGKHRQVLAALARANRVAAAQAHDNLTNIKRVRSALKERTE